MSFLTSPQYLSIQENLGDFLLLIICILKQKNSFEMFNDGNEEYKMMKVW